MNIYVGNLALNVSEAELQQAFEVFGEVASVKIIKDKFSGESKGFGFVEMPSGAGSPGCHEWPEREGIKGTIHQGKPGQAPEKQTPGWISKILASGNVQKLSRGFL